MRDAGEAREDALLLLSAIEGALILARVRQSTEPLNAVARRLREAYRSRLQ